MDVFDSITFEPLKLEFEVLEIISGWMDIAIKTPTRRVEYSVSYVCEPIARLYRVAALLIQNKPLISTSFYISKNDICVIEHDCETEGVYFWLFIRQGQEVVMLCFHDAYDFLENIIEASLNKNTYNLYEYEDFDETKLEHYIKFALKGTVEDYVLALKSLHSQTLEETGTAHEWPLEGIKNEDVEIVNKFFSNASVSS